MVRPREEKATEGAPMSIRFVCRNGHLLRTDNQHAGRRTKCPRCHAAVVVPTLERRTQVTDTEAVRILGHYSPRGDQPAPMPSAKMPTPDRTCPNCRSRISALLRICPQCQVYVGAVQ
jgi:hypothetical protein